MYLLIRNTFAVIVTSPIEVLRQRCRSRSRRRKSLSGKGHSTMRMVSFNVICHFDHLAVDHPVRRRQADGRNSKAERRESMASASRVYRILIRVQRGGRSIARARARARVREEERQREALVRERCERNASLGIPIDAPRRLDIFTRHYRRKVIAFDTRNSRGGEAAGSL